MASRLFLEGLTPEYINALKGQIIQDHMKEGITEVAKLRELVEKELPQILCDVVNPLFPLREEMERERIGILLRDYQKTGSVWSSTLEDITRQCERAIIRE